MEVNASYPWKEVKTLRVQDGHSDSRQAGSGTRDVNVRYMGSIKADNLNSDLIAKLYNNMEKEGKKHSKAERAKNNSGSSSDESDKNVRSRKKGKGDWFSTYMNEVNVSGSESSAVRVKSYTKKRPGRRSASSSDSDSDNEQSRHSKPRNKQSHREQKDVPVKRKVGRPKKNPSPEEKGSSSRFSGIRPNPFSRNTVMDITDITTSAKGGPTKKSIKSSARVDSSSDSEADKRKTQKKPEKMFTDSSSDEGRLKIDLKPQITTPVVKRKPGRPRKTPLSESDSNVSTKGKYKRPKSILDTDSGSDSDASRHRHKRKKSLNDRDEPSSFPKKRGRPRKNPSIEAESSGYDRHKQKSYKHIKTINLKTLTSAERYIQASFLI